MLFVLCADIFCAYKRRRILLAVQADAKLCNYLPLLHGCYGKAEASLDRIGMRRRIFWCNRCNGGEVGYFYKIRHSV